MIKTFISSISGNEFPVTEKVAGKTIRKTILDLIQEDHPEFTATGSISISEMNYYREKYISDYLVKEVGQLSELENTVLVSLKNYSTITDKVDGDEQQNLTFGQRVADKVADFGGSWIFIISFISFLLAWIAMNAFWLANRGFDPFPFILLNLILSCVAALQAPVIMMSQNRQEEKDRDRAKKDYMINLKSEIEIRILHEKVDHMIMHQQQELVEIQKVQIDMLNDILSRMEEKKPGA
ncbi:MAG: DUF1003 domain-containing protein [Lentimicrobiaceae bacterium]|nr:DUF1003 domain-containing protein [Lentimicrobiaceae bacterium]